MNRRQFSDQLLFAIRNHIPIRFVIEEVLHIPSKIAQGTVRFRCPLCGKYNTATQLSTNLARCFLCEKNFNTIDIVIKEKKIEFVETVNLLIPYIPKLSHNENPDPKFTDIIPLTA